MSTAASSPAPGELDTGAIRTSAISRQAMLWGLAGIVLGGAILRFATLGLQSYHHDELVTVARVLPGSFREMLHEVKVSESNPPLYYSLAWIWSRLFGFGEVGIRSLSALFGTALIPVGYLVGRQLTGRRGGLVLAALIAFNPMLIWYSQEARSYVLLVFFGALSLLFFLRALDSRRGLDLMLWAGASALALCSHYFAAFAIAIEAAWLALALRPRWRQLLGPFGLLALVSLALLPLLKVQTNASHIGWIDNHPLSERLLNASAAGFIGETGSVIGHAPQNHFAVLPAILFAVALAVGVVWGSRREWRRMALLASIGFGVVALACLGGLVGKDYVIDRNLLPALVPLIALAAVACTVERARWVGGLLALALCVYWVAFDIHVTRTPTLQRPEYGKVAGKLGPAHGRRAIITWSLSTVEMKWYIGESSHRLTHGFRRFHEVDVVAKNDFALKTVKLPHAMRLVERRHLPRFTISRYVAQGKPLKLHFKQLNRIQTGFASNAILVDKGKRPR